MPVSSNGWIVPDAEFNKTRIRYPDLLVAFGVDPAAYYASNGYVIPEQGKPPDFVLEVASASTARRDLNEKRDYYAGIGVAEYWLFDRTGEYYGTRLAGYRLENGGYVPIEVADLPDGDLQGYSAALGLHLRAEGEELAFYDPATGRRILTYEDQQARADTAEVRADSEQTARLTAEAELSLEREARATEQARADAAEAELAAERARVRELEERLRRDT